MLLEIGGIILGLILLTYGADKFVTGAANIACNLGISPMVIGLTIVGLATSAPEILVGSVAALDGKTSLAIGNAIGSNITNIGLVLGLTVAIMPIVIESRTLRQEYLLMIGASVAVFLLMLDLGLSQLDGVILLGLMIATAIIIVRVAVHAAKTDPLVAEYNDELSGKSDNLKSAILFCIGLVLLLVGAELLVQNAVDIAKRFGISDLVIGLTIVAIGTSLPELAASLMSVIKKEPDIAIGNVIGSNIFNMLAVLSIPVMIHPVEFEALVLQRDFLCMFILMLLMGWMVFVHGSGKFSRGEGLFLVACFVCYQFTLYLTSTGGQA